MRKVYLRDTRTGEAAVYEDHADLSDNQWLWQWTEGNYGCDCNRFIFLREGTGLDDEMECSIGKPANLIVIDKVEKDGESMALPGNMNDG